MRLLAEQAIACWRGEPSAGPWAVEVRANGGNGVVLRADRDGHVPLAVKLSPVDGRDRGQREHDALTALAGSGLAPDPVALVVEPGGEPVTALVTSWVEGVPWPVSWPDATRIADLLARLHRLPPPDGMRPAFPEPDAETLLQRGKRRLTELPPEVAASLAADLDRLMARAPGAAARALVHTDPSPANVLGTATGPVLVDWEYAGLGDPTLDFAYLCAHPTMLDVFAEHPDRCTELAERLGGNDFSDRTTFTLTAVVLYWMIIHEILLRTPAPRIAGARQRDPATMRGQLARYRAWFQRLDDK